jgi:hypothetical protein
MLAILVSGLLLSATLAMYIMVLGPEYTSMVSIPFIKMVK